MGTYGQLYAWLLEQLSHRDNADNESRWLIESQGGAKFLELRDKIAPEQCCKKIEEAAAQIRGGVPFQYVLGEQDFYGLTFKVNQNVLVPRPETELLVDTALAWAAKRTGPIKALDLCTGSGCIIVALAKQCQGEFVAGDISGAALEVAAVNAERHGVTVDCRIGDLWDVVARGEKFDLITANPPYLSAEDMALIAPELAYEPSLALFGGEDGLVLYQPLISQAPKYLNPGGLFLLEIGESQGPQVLRWAEKAFTQSEIKLDLAGRPRLLIASEPR